MSVSVTITNLSSVGISLSEAYVSLGASGSSNDSVTIQRSVAELDSMRALKDLVDAGTISISALQSSSNVDLMSIPLEQHGIESAMTVNAVAEVTAAVAFANAFPAGIVPVITTSIDKTNGPLSRGEAYVENVTNAGFDIKLDVTTAAAGLTVDVNWKATY